MLSLIVATVLWQETTVVIEHVSIVDAQSSLARGDQTVLIRGDEIVAVGLSSSIDVPAGAKRINGKGKYLTPGLWDMSVSLADLFTSMMSYRSTGDPADNLPLFTANGVTSVRDAGGDWDRIKKWRDEITAGERIGPRIYAAGRPVDLFVAGQTVKGPHESSGKIYVTTEDEAREAVRYLKVQGADFVSIAPWGSQRAPFFALADECKELNMPLVGQVPMEITEYEAIDAGMLSIHRINGLMREFTDKEKLKEAENQITINVTRTPRNVLGRLSRQDQDEFNLRRLKATISAHDETKAKALYKHFADNNIYVCPVLTYRFSDPYFDPKAPIVVERKRFVPKYLQESWDTMYELRIQNQTAPGLEYDRLNYQHEAKLIKEMSMAGVKMVTGSDMGRTFYCFPGWGVHDEMARMVSIGFTPYEALVAATKNSADLMGVGDEYGTVEKGKKADLVLLNANPLEDVGAVADISAVFTRGLVYDRPALDKILAKARG